MTWVLVAAVVLAVTYEIVAAVRTGARDIPTISQLIWAGSKRTPIIPFLCGLLAGHLFA